MTIILVQALLITGLFYERERRRVAEIDARRRMSELAHLNRQATAGEMTASIAALELNQPLVGAHRGRIWAKERQGAAPFSACPCRSRRTTREAK